MYQELRNSSRIWAVAVVVIAASLGIATGVLGGEKWSRVADPAERLFDKAFTLSGDGMLEVSLGDFDVELVQGNGDKARVEVYVQGSNRDKAEKFFDKQRYRARMIDDDLVVETRARRLHNFNFWGHHRNLNGRVVITVPRGTRMNVATSDGDIYAETLEGKMRLKSSDGDIEVDMLKGDDVDLRTSDGDILVTSMECKRVSFVTSDGDLRIQSLDADVATFRTSDGDVIISESNVRDLRAQSSDGDIRIDFTGDELVAKTSDGSIRVSISKDCELDLRTSDGNIYVDAMKGLKADVRLRGERVKVYGDIEVRGDVSRRRIVGTLGGGGPDIVATTSDGEIELDLRGRKN